MNNGHGQFTSQDAAEYIAEVSKTDSAVTICSCGAEVEAQPMKEGVCYECYRNPVIEAQQIERAIDATLHAEDFDPRTLAQIEIDEISADWQNQVNELRG